MLFVWSLACVEMWETLKYVQCFISSKITLLDKNMFWLDRVTFLSAVCLCWWFYKFFFSFILFCRLLYAHFLTLTCFGWMSHSLLRTFSILKQIENKLNFMDCFLIICLIFSCLHSLFQLKLLFYPGKVHILFFYKSRTTILFWLYIYCLLHSYELLFTCENFRLRGRFKLVHFFHKAVKVHDPAPNDYFIFFFSFLWAI